VVGQFNNEWRRKEVDGISITKGGFYTRYFAYSMAMYYTKPLWVERFDGVDPFFKWDRRTTSFEETFFLPSFFVIIEGVG